MIGPRGSPASPAKRHRRTSFEPPLPSASHRLSALMSSVVIQPPTRLRELGEAPF
jgi:hypothetical protein